MLIPTLSPEVFRSPCNYSSESINVTGHTTADIAPVMPYINSLYPKAEYNHPAQIIRFRFDGHLVTLRQNELKVAGFEDGDEAVEALYRLQARLNEIWEQRDEVEPSMVLRQRLKPLDVYQLLPLTNCRDCGEPTCFVFASKLVTHKVEMDVCTPLCSDPLYADKKQAMRQLLNESL
jgi:ArsR family metal-binding transcriptional regulator